MSLSEKLKSTELKQNTSLKLAIIGIVLLVLMIPMSMVSSLVHEREFRKASVIEEINHKWGQAQTITGPYFSIPYKDWYQDHNKERRFRMNYLHILPQDLEVNGDLTPHIRYRSIYEAVLYNAQLSIQASFTTPDLRPLNIKAEDVLWDKGRLNLGLSDMRGIQKSIPLFVNHLPMTINPGIATQDLSATGISANVPFAIGEEPMTVQLKLDLNGSQEFQLVPLAKQTSMHLNSSWSSPSFNGAFLPRDHNITQQGFSANWQVLHLNRNYPQIWSGDQYQVQDSAFGLSLIVPADIYQKSTRLHKYAIVFILFTFAALFLSEVSNRKPLHPIQYILIGLSIVLFYSLQLALSEHLGFDLAYTLAAVITLLIISAYSSAITHSKRFGIIVATILLILYGYLYLVLQLQDYALLMGSIGLTLVLATVMYTTRKIDWYNHTSEQ